MSLFTRNSAHKNAQKSGRIRDLNTCQFCGSRSKPEGHHINFLSKGGAAHKDNIITLCHDCHLDVHKGKKQVSKF